MHAPPWLKPAGWGVGGCALGIMIIGFAWWGWVLGSTAERLAKDRVDGAVTAVMVPICVARFMGQADAAAKLAAFRHTVSWRRSHVLGQGGWAAQTRMWRWHGVAPNSSRTARPSLLDPRRATQALDHRPRPHGTRLDRTPPNRCTGA